VKQPIIKVFVLPGGKMPTRQTEGAIGYDVYLRALVSANEMDQHNAQIRKTLFDFENYPEDQEVQHFVERKKEEFVYRLEPGKIVLAGIGFVTEMDFPYFYWVAPRSGLASKYGITVGNAPGTVDPDYRGEAGVVLVNQSQKSFYLYKDMRIAQIIFMPATIPMLEPVAAYGDLESTKRGTGGFGSTGLR
jgi:dUTP pyrophosphatase